VEGDYPFYTRTCFNQMMPSTSIHHEFGLPSADLTEIRRCRSEPDLEAAQDGVDEKPKTNVEGNQLPVTEVARPIMATVVAQVLRNRHAVGKKREPEKRGQRLKVFEDLTSQLDTSQGEHSIFLCWTDQDSKTWALPVLVKDPEDEVQIYRSLRHEWFEKARAWRSKLLFRRVSALKEIRVC
jgi:hypothetical protein